MKPKQFTAGQPVRWRGFNGVQEGRVHLAYPEHWKEEKNVPVITPFALVMVEAERLELVSASCEVVAQPPPAQRTTMDVHPARRED